MGRYLGTLGRGIEAWLIGRFCVNRLIADGGHTIYVYGNSRSI